jgi:hypothetical protein
MDRLEVCVHRRAAPGLQRVTWEMHENMNDYVELGNSNKTPATGQI